MVTDQQVRLLMSLIEKGLSLTGAAAKSGMTERTYRQVGLLPSERRAGASGQYIHGRMRNGERWSEM